MTRNGLLVIALLAVLGAVGAALLLLREPADGGERPGVERTADEAADGQAMELVPTTRERGMDLDTSPREGEARPMLQDSQLPARIRGEVVDRSGHGIEGAAVALLGVDDMGLAKSYVATDLRADCEPDGRFDLVGVPADTLVVAEARAPGFAPATSAPFRVPPAGNRDLGRLVLDPGTKLTGRVTDMAKAPLEGAVVRVDEMGRTDAAGDPLPVASAVTDAEGRYEVEGLATRQYGLAVTHEGYSEVDLVLSFVLGRSDVWVQDVEMETADSVLGGVVLSSDDMPVAGLELRVLRRRPTGASYFTATTVTGDDGTFLFPSVSAGRYELELRSPLYYLATPEKLEAGFTDHRVRVHPALTVLGRMITETATPLPRRFEVTARPDGRTGAALLDAATRVRQIENADPPGTFRFDGLRPGTYQFTVAAPGFAVTTSQDVELGTAVPEVEVVIPLLAGGFVVGRVDPPPESSARVELREASWDPSLPLEHAFPTAPLPGLVAKVANDGTFRIAHVPEGAYVLSLRAEGLPALHVRDVAVVEGGSTDVGALHLFHGGSVVGTVTGTDGRPLAGAPVTITGDSYHERLSSDPDGGFRFDAVPPGNYTIVSTPPELFSALKYEARSEVEVRADVETSTALLMGERVRDR
ncbi:MAG: carboxypeptidase regulatory-like domain-containing protein [Planctomycetes bacterium]|nr:carboxypeptidase regulatory-like domain-containing protein [Planctomycetota bacterium]